MMNDTAADADFPQGPGPASVILASVGLLLFFLPILGGPLSALGLLAGLAGVLMAMLGGRSSLLWSLAGSCIGAVALTLNLALALAPLIQEPDSPRRSAQHPDSDRAYVSPPATQPR